MSDYGDNDGHDETAEPGMYISMEEVYALRDVIRALAKHEREDSIGAFLKNTGHLRDPAHNGLALMTLLAKLGL